MQKDRLFPALAIFFVSLLVVACSSSDDDGMPQMGGMPPDMEQMPTDGDSMDMVDLGQWDDFIVGGRDVGYMNSTHGLDVQYDTAGENPAITASSPGQPTVSGTWTGMWKAVTGAQLDGYDDGTAEIDVAIQGSTVEATLTYNDVSGFGTVTADPAVVSATGHFAPSQTVDVQGVPTVFGGEGQFGGTDQRGVAGYIRGPNFRSVFYGDRDN